MPLPMFSDQSPKSIIKNKIAIAAGKGGVGKSTVTVNMAYALRNLGYSVGVLDVDIYGPSIRKMLPEDVLPEQKGQMLIPAVCRGIKMISMAYFRKEGEASAVRAPIANGIVAQFIDNVFWGDLDFLLIDFPPGTGDVQLTMSQKVNLSGALMVTTPQEVALLDVRKAIHLFDQVNVPVVGIIENMSFFEDPNTGKKVYLFGQNGGKRLSQQVGAPFLGQIPLDPEICQAGDNGTSLFEKECKAAQAYLEVSRSFVDHLTLLNEQWEDCMQKFELEWVDEGSLTATHPTEG